MSIVAHRLAIAGQDHVAGLEPAGRRRRPEADQREDLGAARPRQAELAGPRRGDAVDLGADPAADLCLRRFRDLGLRFGPHGRRRGWRAGLQWCGGRRVRRGACVLQPLEPDGGERGEPALRERLQIGFELGGIPAVADALPESDVGLRRRPRVVGRADRSGAHR
ncbi:MAG: hypothetical protein M5U07_16285 [Xanthobacteraceae bacterium]|nr:hypothetical protein [Xanthobacteraceae bacterium]